MKFSNQLQFNAKPEWMGHYMDYDNLKDYIYELEQKREHHEPLQASYRDDADLETRGLLASGDGTRPSAANAAFIERLDANLARVQKFYKSKEEELAKQLDECREDAKLLDNTSYAELSEDENDGWWQNSVRKLKGMVDGRPRERKISARSGTLRSSSFASEEGLDSLSSMNSPAAQVNGESSATERPRNGGRGSFRPAATGRRLSQATFDYDDDDDDDDDDDMSQFAPSRRMHASTVSAGRSPRALLKRKLINLYTDLNSLRAYESSNYTGFRKILKKYDKTLHESLMVRYMEDVVGRAEPHTMEAKNRLTSYISEVVNIFANNVTNPRGDETQARTQLSSYLQDYITYERNNVWRDMIAMERTKAKDRGESRPIVESSSFAEAALSTRIINTPCGRLRLPRWLNRRTVAGSVALGLLIGICNSQILTRAEERNCLGLLVFVTIFWAMEVIELFVTAFLVPFLVVTLRVIKSEDGKETRLSAAGAAHYIFQQMFSPTIMLLLGGFTLAAALSKVNIHKVLAQKVLRLAGTKPSTVLLAYMGVSAFASMWISNVAAPVLCYSLIEPILRTIDDTTSKFPKALILGIALAANVGGQLSPISSPQNLIALEYMRPPVSWLEWFAVSIPTGLISVVAIWALLLFAYPLKANHPPIQQTQDSNDKWGFSQTFVMLVSLVTIVMLCIERQLIGVFGEMGVIGIIPIVIFFGTGILKKDDFQYLPWNVVYLAMGGIALGKSVVSSGLLDDLDRVLERTLSHLGDSVWLIVALVCGICLVVATLISHTVASALIVPIAAKIGEAIGDRGGADHSRLLIFVTALVCSAGMGLPVSGYPNMTAINRENSLGKRYLEVGDFLRNGIPASIIATIVIATVSYGIMLWIKL